MRKESEAVGRVGAVQMKGGLRLQAEMRLGIVKGEEGGESEGRVRIFATRTYFRLGPAYSSELHEFKGIVS